MPELRYNSAAREWVIIATERAKRPEDFAGKAYEVSKDSAEKCPFCNGREQKTPPEIFAVRDPGTQPNTPGWRVRVTPNAFPALQPQGTPSRRKSKTGFISMDGVGMHEVIIETPEHEQIIATMSAAQVEAIYLTYRERYVALAKDPRFEAVILFKNHGRGAGTSLHHPHSQIIAVPVVPSNTQSRIEIARAHFDVEGACLYCDMMRMEGEDGQRIIFETESFLVFCPFASRMPFETWVVPKKHMSNFEEISVEMCKELAHTMQKILGKINKVLNNPDFNYAIYSAPCKEHNLEHFHWSMKIFPRVSNPAGFEIGSGMMINPVVPELAAKYLREA